MLFFMFWQRHVKIRRTGGGAPDLASGLSLHQVQSLQLVAWLMSVCHVILGNGTFKSLFFDILRNFDESYFFRVKFKKKRKVRSCKKFCTIKRPILTLSGC